jgi:hypothetical protein
MKLLSENDAIQAINEMQAVPRETIRSFQNYFLGIINRYMRAHESKQRSSRDTYRDNRHRHENNVRMLDKFHFA